jgi:PEGA domain
MKRLLGLITLIAVVPSLWAGEAKEYPITLKVLETDAISSKADGTQSTTTCTSTRSANEITCDPKQIPGATHTQLVSVAASSDGNTYVIECVLGAGRRFLAGAGQSMQANGGLATVSGCNVPPGTYKARWDQGHLKVLHEKNGKSKETAFAVLSSAPTPVRENGHAHGPVVVGSAEKTILHLSSTPAGADIELDGSFVGQTPSSVLVLPGDHSVKITKTGYKQWERKIKTSGGEVTMVAELESQH